MYKKRKLNAILAGIFACGIASAVEYTDKVVANGENIVLQHGDSVVINSNTSSENNNRMQIVNGGGITVANPETDGISVNAKLFTSSTAPENTTAIFMRGNASLNLGTGSTITSNATGVYIGNASTFTANKLTIICGTENSPAQYHYSNGLRFGDNSVTDNNSVANVGSNSTIRMYGTSSASNGIFVEYNNTLKAESNLTVELFGGAGRAVSIQNGGTVDLGKNATIWSSSSGYGVIAFGGKVNADTLKLTTTNAAALAAASGTQMTLSSVDIDSAKQGLIVALTSVQSAGGKTTTVDIRGGTIKSKLNVVNFTGAAQYSGNPANAEINLSGGLVASSENGIFADYSNVTSGVSLTSDINVFGIGTVVNGRFIENKAGITSTFSLTDGATWNSVGSSKMDNIILGDALINLTLTQKGECITTDTISNSGQSLVMIDLTNDFLAEILNDLPYQLDAVVFNSGDDSGVTYILNNINGDGSTWDVTDLGHGSFLISNISIVPEPSIFALIFGTMAAASVMFRRKKNLA